MSKSGIGWSVGTKGFRFTKKAGGGYRTTASIPGTGISHTKDYRAAGNASAKSYAAPTTTESGHDTSYPKKKTRSFWSILLVIYLICSVIGILFCLPAIWIRWHQSSDIIPTDVIQTENVWYPHSSIQFAAAPDAAMPGEEMSIEVKGRAAVIYSISVLTDKGPVKDYRLISQQADLLGNAEWSWEVPSNTEPGIYYIQVSDHDGNINRIDYSVLDKNGQIVGEPPSRDLSTESAPTELTVEDEDVYWEEQQAENTVYITESGAKYHKFGCRHLADSKIETTLDAAIAAGYTPCGTCY